MSDAILTIENDIATATSIREALGDVKYGAFAVERVTTLAAGIERLARGGDDIKAVLLDLSLPDSQGLATFNALLPAAGNIPVLILSDIREEDTAQQAVRAGAQDYFLKTHLDGYTLSHTLHNVMARSSAENALFIEKERAQITLNSIGDAVISADTVGNLTYMNRVAEHMTGWSRAKAIGRPLTEVLQIIDNDTRQITRNPVELAMQRNKAVGLSANCVLVRRDGVEIPIEDSAAPIRDRSERVVGAVIVFHDVSEARAMVLKMSHLAQHDFLTDLPNRVLLSDRLEQSISLARRRRTQLAVLFLDLDLFKNINDSMGHSMGDKLLQAVAERLVSCVRDSDTVSRQGGDEFVILLSEIEQPRDAARRAETIIAALTRSYPVDGHELSITVSVGIATYPGDSDNAGTLIKYADTAMYHAKENGRNQYRFFKPEMNNKVVERQAIETDLHGALSRQEFILHYQPKVNLETGAITGAEALIRWNHPQLGLLLPDQFIPVAEAGGLIVPIGRWVLEEACRQARRRLDAGLDPVSISVNVSPAEFRDKDFLRGVGNTLNRTRLPPRFLEIEITENVLMQDCESSIAVLNALKALGVKLAIDDFGTGYSSLNYLKRFPIDTLKIDKSFVRDITTDTDDATIVSAVIGMGNNLNKRVSAEGVETQQQLAFLQVRHCAEGQGYHFSRPVVEQEYVRLLDTGIPVPA